MGVGARGVGCWLLPSIFGLGGCKDPWVELVAGLVAGLMKALAFQAGKGW